MSEANLRRDLVRLERSIIDDARSDDNRHYMWETFGDLVDTYELGQNRKALLALELLQYLGTRATARTADKLREWAHVEATTCTFEEYVHDTTLDRGLQTDIMRYGSDPILALICRGLWSMPPEARVAVMRRVLEKGFVSADFASTMPVYQNRLEPGLRFRVRECMCYVRMWLWFTGVREAVYTLVPKREVTTV